MWTEGVASDRTGRLIQTCRATLCFTESGQLVVRCRITATRRMQRLGVTCVRIQNCFGADAAIVWNTDPLREGMTGYNCSAHEIVEPINLPPGTYTAAVTFYAKTVADSDARTCRTAPLMIPETQ